MKNVTELNELYNFINETEEKDRKEENLDCESVKITSKKGCWVSMAPTVSSENVIKNHTKYKEALFGLLDAINYLTYVEYLFATEDSERRCVKNKCIQLYYEPSVLAKGMRSKGIECEDEGELLIETRETEFLENYVSVGINWGGPDSSVDLIRWFYLSVNDLKELGEKYNINILKSVSYEQIKTKKYSDEWLGEIFEFTPDIDKFYEKECLELSKK